MTSIRTSPDVLVAHLAGEAVLLNLSDKSYYRLNETAAFVWSKIEAGNDRNSILNSLLETYDVGPEEAERELTRVLDELTSRGLVATAT